MSKTQSPNLPRLTVDEKVSRGEYANFVSIAHNYSEVVFDFGRALPGRNDIPVVGRIVMTPLHAQQLVTTLQHNLAKYVESFGPIPTPPAGTTPGDTN